jgi:hypothetical protein
MLELITYQTTEENQVCEKPTSVEITFSTYEEMEQYKHKIEESSKHKVLLTYRDTSNKKTEEEYG